MHFYLTVRAETPLPQPRLLHLLYVTKSYQEKYNNIAIGSMQWKKKITEAVKLSWYVQNSVMSCICLHLNYKTSWPSSSIAIAYFTEINITLYKSNLVLKQ